jgi:hypothetical protein
MSRGRTPRFVPPLVFSTCVASVVPACGGTTVERTGDGGSGGGQSGYNGFGGVIVLAVGGFGNGGYYGQGGGIIVLAVAGYNGYGGYTGFGGVIALGVAGFAYPPGGAFGAGGRRDTDAGVDSSTAGGVSTPDSGTDADVKDSGGTD